MGFFKSTKGSIISDYFMLLDDAGSLKANTVCDLALYDDYLELKASDGQVKLRYNQITDVFHGWETEIVETDKSVIGRAVAGGLLFGETGAVIGAISGTGKTEKTIYKYMLIISYTSSSGEESFLSFEDTRRYKGKKIAAKLKEFTEPYRVEKPKPAEFL